MQNNFPRWPFRRFVQLLLIGQKNQWPLPANPQHHHHHLFLCQWKSQSCCASAWSTDINEVVFESSKSAFLTRFLHSFPQWSAKSYVITLILRHSKTDSPGVRLIGDNLTWWNVEREDQTTAIRKWISRGMFSPTIEGFLSAMPPRRKIASVFGDSWNDSDLSLFLV